MTTPLPSYPLQFSVDYPEEPRNRLTVAFRIFVIIPIVIVLAYVGGSAWGTDFWGFGDDWDRSGGVAWGGGGILMVAPALLILFRQKYPRWWFNWNLELLRFQNRVVAYLALLRDEYPSTDEEQLVHLEIPYPEVERDLVRWMPLVKWLLAIPHYIVLFFLVIAAWVVAIIAWFAILITGNYPRNLFDFTVGVIRWSNRVTAYAVIMTTDRYPPFRLSE